MLLLDQRDPKSTRQVVAGSVGRVFCMKTKLVADRRLVSLSGCAGVTLSSLVAFGHCPHVVPWTPAWLSSPPVMQESSISSQQSGQGEDQKLAWLQPMAGPKPAPLPSSCVHAGAGMVFSSQVSVIWSTSAPCALYCLGCSRNISQGESSRTGRG